MPKVLEQAPFSGSAVTNPEAPQALTFEEQALLDILTDQPVTVGPNGETAPAIAAYTGQIIGALIPRPERPGSTAAEDSDPLFQGADQDRFLGRLERGQDAAGVVQRAASRFLKPLVSALRGDPTLRSRVDSLLFDGTETAPGRPRRFTVDGTRLQRQRRLGVQEAQYLAIVEDITEVNPYLVAAGATEPALAHAVLKSEFERRSARTRQEIPFGSSVPLVVAGAGIHGTISSGSLLVERPDLIEDTLFLDQASTPGGVFDRANGDAHNVNSANYVGDEPFVLPPQVTDGTVRLEAGLFPQSPGERTDPNGGRTASINRLVPFFPSPDEYNRGVRYVSNWIFSLASKLQDSLLMRRFRGETSLDVIRLNGDGPDEFRVITNDLRTGKPFEVTTSNVQLATGLGIPRRVVADTPLYREVLAEQEKMGSTRFPLYSNAVEAYNYFADRTRGPVENGSTFTIVGSGDSAATLVEALAGLYQEGNLDLSKVKKIFVIAQSPLSERCRYNAINDVLERFEAVTGRKNLLELVQDQVSEIYLQFDPARRSIEENNILLRNKNGENIRAEDGVVLRTDHVIEATGFESELARILAPLLKGMTLEDSITDIRSEANPLVTVGQILTQYPGISIVGTASRPNFTPDKRQTLPEGTQEVLEAVGENVVAIGLRGTDTTIATKQWLRSRRATLPTYRRPAGDAPQEPMSAGKLMSDTFVVPLSQDRPAVDRKLEPNAALLTPMLLIPMSGRKLAAQGTVDSSVPEIMEDGGQLAMFEARMTGQRQFGARITFADNQVRVTPVGQLPSELARELALAAFDPSFQAYALAAMQARRSDSIAIRLSYNGTDLDLENSVVQAA